KFHRPPEGLWLFHELIIHFILHQILSIRILYSSAILRAVSATSTASLPVNTTMGSLPQAPLWYMTSGGDSESLKASSTPHGMVPPSESLTLAGSLLLS